MNSCIEDFRPTKFEMQFLGILHHIIKSAAFNIFLLVLGFCVGFGYVALSFHYHAMTNSNYEFVVKIDKVLEDIEQLDSKYDEKHQEIKDLLKQFKMKIAHDSYNFDHILIKKDNKKTIDNLD